MTDDFPKLRRVYIWLRQKLKTQAWDSLTINELAAKYGASPRCGRFCRFLTLLGWGLEQHIYIQEIGFTQRAHLLLQTQKVEQVLKAGPGVITPGRGSVARTGWVASRLIVEPADAVRTR